MENLENALDYINQEIDLHTKKLLVLKEKLEVLTPKAHELCIEYANTNATEIAKQSKDVGMSISALEREINKLNFYIQSLWNSKVNLTQIIDEEEKINNK